MSIVSVRETRPREDERDESQQRTMRYFVVISSTRNEDPRIVSRADGVPRYNSQLSPTSPQIVLNKTLTRDQSAPYIWHITCEYGLPAEGQRRDESNQFDLPELEAPIVRVSSENSEKVLSHWWRKIGGVWTKKPAVNSAHGKFPGGFVGSELTVIVELTRNIGGETNVIGRKNNFEGSYADHDVFGVDQNVRRARMYGMDYQRYYRFARDGEEEELVHEYWEETLTIGFPPKRNILDEGDFYLWLDEENDWVRKPFVAAGRQFVGMLDQGLPLNGFNAQNEPIGAEEDGGDAAVFFEDVLESEPINWQVTLDLPETLSDIQPILFRERR